MNSKILTVIIAVIVAVIWSCDSNTFEDISTGTVITDTISYEGQVKTIIETRCTGCHSPSGRASSVPLNNYQQVTRSIDRIIDLIQRPAGDPFRMPPNGMPNTEINTIIDWKNKGLTEK
ncbi:hypothetical protein SAMN05443634_107181 [Chishuiella changwenlii]|uniref:Cytochrome c domain-containing protein n=1 Tax=Chishuiella changwenlii TaxID=1434701 RepID=A0A1M6Z5Y0_9FLAO|nr:hypothetical protein [Chishuiella changwenlii]GGE87092.1 hypothetical protein GCM10010984_01070 [Chishuiella changwenlii]SHL25906.1 hypothetical protein SAMN05443634_107181 [Chishuiella changwenlii]